MVADVGCKLRFQAKKPNFKKIEEVFKGFWVVEEKDNPYTLPFQKTRVLYGKSIHIHPDNDNWLPDIVISDSRLNE